jgi:hypothetical protein
MNDHRFQASPAIGQLLPSACAAVFSKNREIFGFDDIDIPSVRQILAPLKRVIDLTYDDDRSKGDDGNLTAESQLRYIRRTRHRVRLTSSSLIDRLRIAY